jgi:predicted RNA binding protein YcfA (HicA-like mRNA interferase family)
MPKLPSMSSSQLARMLEKAGAVFVRQEKQIIRFTQEL